MAHWVKNLPANSGDTEVASLITGWGRFPGGGNDNPLQYPCLENPMDRGAWQATSPWLIKESDTTEYEQTLIVHVETPGRRMLK